MADFIETETTEQGEQLLISDVRPITLCDRLVVRAAQPMVPKRNPNAHQKPCNHGLFDDAARNQLDMFDPIHTVENRAKPFIQPNSTPTQET